MAASTTSLKVPPTPLRTALMSSTGGRRPLVAAVRADRAVQRRGGRGAHEPGHRPDAGGHVTELAERLAGHPRRRPHGPELLVGAADHVEDGGGGQLLARRRRLRLPGDGWRGRRVRGVVHDHRQQVGAGDAVDHAVVGLGDHGPAVLLEALDHPDLPQRLAPVEALRHDPAHETAQLALAPRRRQRRVADVVLDVEVGVVGPHGPAEVERHGADDLAVARDERQLALHHRDHAIVAGAGPSKMPIDPMCMWLTSSSMCRNDESSGLMRSSVMVAPPGDRRGRLAVGGRAREAAGRPVPSCRCCCAVGRSSRPTRCWTAAGWRSGATASPPSVGDPCRPATRSTWPAGGWCPASSTCTCTAGGRHLHGRGPDQARSVADLHRRHGTTTTFASLVTAPLPRCGARSPPSPTWWWTARSPGSTSRGRSWPRRGAGATTRPTSDRPTGTSSPTSRRRATAP
jgi:hypothetical protein